jgi:hypothetical protein
VFESLAFLNFFARPADCGDSFRYLTTELDISRSQEVFDAVLKIIRPDLVCVVSRYAWPFVRPMVRRFLPCDAIGTAHPNCKWWNCSSKDREAGKLQVGSFLKERFR